MWAKCSWYCPFKIPSFGEDPDIAVILGGLALKLGEAGVEAGVLWQDWGDQESNLQKGLILIITAVVIYGSHH